MSFSENVLYMEDVTAVAGERIPWEKLQNKAILISGATGMLGSFLIDVLMYRNRTEDMQCHVLALGRNEEKARARFGKYFDEPTFSFCPANIEDYGDLESAVRATGMGENKPIHFIFHAASNTHPLAYAEDPIGTITANIQGTNNLLRLGSELGCERFIFASSNEIYGENRGDVEFFDENYCGYINSNTLRAGYPEGKRCGEALCQAYIRQKGMDAVIARFTRSYGPSMLASDTKAISQFIKKGIAGENIVLKSEGNQFFSYTYVADAISGMLTVLLKGTCGEAYNIADERSDIRLKDLAGIIADEAGTKVVFELPDETEKAGYSTATKARLSGEKLKSLGWNAKYSIEVGIQRTMRILRE